MSELNAAVGVIQMQRLDDLLKRRNEVAKHYNAIIAEIEGVSPLTIVPTTTRMSWFVYSARFDEDIDRNMVMQKLAEMGIPARPYFSPIHLQPFYQKQFNFAAGDFPEAEAAGNSILALPFYTNMNADEIEVVCSALQEAVQDSRR
jgi:dTDP-4-amino-4,6-dideoxygalactose transaminase